MVEQPPIQRRPLAEAHLARLRGRLASRRGEPASESFEEADRRFRDLSMPFWVAVTSLEHAEHLLATDRTSDAEPLLNEAIGTFEQLGAVPWAARVQAARAPEKNVNRIFTPPA